MLTPKNSAPVVLILLGVLFLTIGPMLGLDATSTGTYRGYTIYYDRVEQHYIISGLDGTYNYRIDAMDAIDDYLGPLPPENSAPHAESGGTYSGKVDTTIYFYSTGSYDLDGDQLAYKWNFGDGDTSASSSPGHKYTSPGTYQVKLTVTDPDGLKDSDFTTCTVTVIGTPDPDPDDPAPDPEPEPNKTPTADAGGPYSGKVGVPIMFNGGGSYDPDGSIIGYRWNFGDGSTSNGGTTVHTYNEPGTYTVTLKVTDNEGAQDFQQIDCTVTAASSDPDDTNDPDDIKQEPNLMMPAIGVTMILVGLILPFGSGLPKFQ